MKPIGLLIASAMLACSWNVAMTACPVSFSASTISLTYDPLNTYQGSQISQTFSLVAQPDDSSNPTFTAQFVDTESAAPLHISTGPIYHIQNGSQTIVVGSSAAQLQAAQSLGGTFSGAGNITFGSLTFSLDGAQNIPAGTYSESLSVQFTCAGEGGTVHTSTGVLPVSITVPKTILATLGGADHGTLDLGDLTSSATASIAVQSTSAYTVTVTPDVGHAMSLQGAPTNVAALANAKMNYSVKLDGSDASNGLTVSSGTAGVGTNVTRSLVVAPTELASNKRAGTYTGTITVRFSPQ